GSGSRWWSGWREARRSSARRRKRLGRPSVRALASPASLKGVLSAPEAAALLAEGLRDGGADVEELPIADGGEGTGEVLGARVAAHVRAHDAFGRPREAPIRRLPDNKALVEAADVIPLDPALLHPVAP